MHCSILFIHQVLKHVLDPYSPVVLTKLLVKLSLEITLIRQ
jgi:hypothetical protein